MKSDNFEQVGPLFERVMEGLGLSSQLRQWKAIGGWPQAVGEKMANRTKCVRVQGGVLWIQASGPQWAAEVSMRKSEIIDKLNELAGENVLTDIRFVGAWEGRR